MRIANETIPDGSTHNTLAEILDRRESPLHFGHETAKGLVGQAVKTSFDHGRGWTRRFLKAFCSAVASTDLRTSRTQKSSRAAERAQQWCHNRSASSARVYGIHARSEFSDSHQAAIYGRARKRTRAVTHGLESRSWKGEARLGCSISACIISLPVVAANQ